MCSIGGTGEAGEPPPYLPLPPWLSAGRISEAHRFDQFTRPVPIKWRTKRVIPDDTTQPIPAIIPNRSSWKDKLTTQVRRTWWSCVPVGNLDDKVSIFRKQGHNTLTSYRWCADVVWLHRCPISQTALWRENGRRLGYTSVCRALVEQRYYICTRLTLSSWNFVSLIIVLVSTSACFWWGLVRSEYIADYRNELTMLSRNAGNAHKMGRNHIVKDKLPRLPAKNV